MFVAGMTFLMPFFWVISTSLKVPNRVFEYPIRWIPTDPQWDNYIDMFTGFRYGGTEEAGGVPALLYFFRNTFFIATLATLGTICSSSVVAYGLTRLDWKGREIVFGLTLVTMMLPSVVTLVPTFIIFRHLQWIDTFLPLIVPSWFGGGAFYIFLLRQFFSTLPAELDEAAIVDGASPFRILWQIILPLSRPALASVGIFSFLFHYNNFMGPLIYLNTNEKFPISLGLSVFSGRYGNNWPLVMAVSTTALLPVIILFFLAQKTFIQGIHMSGIAGR
jgi:ABC-type glycerol-3-phosphate transport system permease component